MTSKFEQLIEYVINDEEAKAKELFHEIVVEKSREIYENLMTEEEDEEELDEAKHDDEEELDEAKHDDEEELDEAKHDDEEELDENMMGGDASDDLIDDVEAEEQGMEMAEGDGEEGLEDRVVDLEDKLDELMAEFEALMGDDADDSVGDEMGGDDLEMDDTDTAEFDMDGEEEEELEMGMMEAVSLAKVAPAKMGDDGANTKSVVPQNSGAKGAMASPVKMTGDTAQGRPAPKAGELIGKVQNSVGGDKKMSPATKPVTAQASGVNTKTPFPKA
jgi:hypothetical protein